MIWFLANLVHSELQNTWYYILCFSFYFSTTDRIQYSDNITEAGIWMMYYADTNLSDYNFIIKHLLFIVTHFITCILHHDIYIQPKEQSIWLAFHERICHLTMQQSTASTLSRSMLWVPNIQLLSMRAVVVWLLSIRAVVIGPISIPTAWWRPHTILVSVIRLTTSSSTHSTTSTVSHSPT